MRNLLLGVTGSVAAIRTPELARALSAQADVVRVVTTEPALYFFDPDEVRRSDGEPIPVLRDADEWPGSRYRRGDPVLHIELRTWADGLIVAPLDANSLAKFALGLADNLLTCLFRAWEFDRKPVVLAPAMNTRMWENPPTRRHLHQLLTDHGRAPIPQDWPLDQVDAVFAAHAPGIVIVPPQAKRLACGDFGVGAMAEVVTLAETVRRVFESAEM